MNFNCDVKKVADRGVILKKDTTFVHETIEQFADETFWFYILFLFLLLL